jgi:hypothetical protein
MLGAMAGLGQGMQNFSTMLNEKAKMDWQTQRDQALWERQKNLEEIKMRHAETMQGNQQEFLGGQQDKQMEFQAQNQQIADLNAESRLNTEIGFKREMSTEEHSNRLSEISAQAAKQVSVAKQLANFADEKDEAKRAKQLASLEKNEDFQSLDPVLQKIVKMKADPLMEPMGQALLASYGKGGTEFTGRDLVAFQKNSSEKWQTLGPDGQEALAEKLNDQEKAIAKQEGRKPQPLDLNQVESIFHANEFKKLQGIAGRPKGMLGSPAATPTATPATDAGLKRYSPSDIPKMAQMILSGKGTLEEAKARMVPDQYLALENQIESMQQAPSKPQVAPVDSSGLSPATQGMLSGRAATWEDVPVVGDAIRQRRKYPQK